MNSAQRIILAVAMILLVCMLIFPPWIFVYQPSRDSFGPFSHKATRAAGYHLLFSSHTPQDQTQLTALFGLPSSNRWASLSHFSIIIDRDRLYLQLGGLATITVLLLLLTRKKNGS